MAETCNEKCSMNPWRLHGPSRLACIVIALILVLPPAAHGIIYGWTDSRGITHYTNKEDEIPGRYRVRARLLYREKSETPSRVGQSVADKQAVPETHQPDKLPAVHQSNAVDHTLM